MPTREYYLEQARLLLELAKTNSDPAAAGRMIEHAVEYQILAEAIPDEDTPPPPAASVQQQKKTEDE
jgi:hypothetical protein